MSPGSESTVWARPSAPSGDRGASAPALLVTSVELPPHTGAVTVRVFDPTEAVLFLVDRRNATQDGTDDIRWFLEGRTIRHCSVSGRAKVRPSDGDYSAEWRTGDNERSYISGNSVFTCCARSSSMLQQHRQNGPVISTYLIMNMPYPVFAAVLGLVHQLIDFLQHKLGSEFRPIIGDGTNTQGHGPGMFVHRLTDYIT